MYFKKLEIAGFKSFAEKTVLHFEPGITAVVGPNGCGKSNIFDSIRWCLGEQSIKSLRGSRMEDVIFNGTETAPAQGAAEVSLTISNEAKILPIDYEEVTITRRLFRSGESEYLINNNPVRLKDINELLMGTGIGAESYSLVEQGKIDLVISSKPEDRRLVFDEATGVSKYKAKKKEAAKKLEETDNNLLRVNDIITEVKRQIGSIERQAAKARRYKEVFDKLKDFELKYADRELKTLKSELAMLAEFAKRSREEEHALNTQLEDLDKKLMHQQKQLQELDARIASLKDGIVGLENTNDRNHQHIGLNRERIEDLKKHNQLLEAQRSQLQERIAAHQKSIAELNDQLLSIHEVFAAKEQDLAGKEQQLTGLNADIETAQTEIKTHRSRIFDANRQEAQANNQLNENLSAMHTFSSRLRRLETEQLKTQEENSEILNGIGNVSAEISAQKSKIDAVTARWEVFKQEKAGLENSMREEEAALRGFENEKLGLLSQAQFLKEVKLKYDQMPQAQNGSIEIDSLPPDKISGIIASARDVRFDPATKTYRISCELKFISFDLAQIEARIDELSRAIEERIGALSEKEKLLMSRLKDLEVVEEELQQERYQLTNKEAVATNLSTNARKISDELSLIAMELAEVGENLKKCQELDVTLKDNVSKIKGEIGACEEAISSNTNRVNQNVSAREGVLVEISRLKAELDNQRSREESLEAGLNFFKNSLGQDTATLDLHAGEIASSCQKIEELDAESLALETQIEGNRREIEVKTKEFNSLSVLRTEEINGLDFIQKQIIDLEEKTDKIKEDNHRFQMQDQELNFKYAGIKNRILSSYNVDLEEAPLAVPPAEELPMEQLSQEIAALKEKVESFGTVNLVAIEELEELKNRFDFLNQQQNDLLTAKDSLQKAILKINRTTRKMFLETFQIVAEEFKNYFRLLFGGGEARLFLIDEEDVLESGIEIICRPPGKKLQNITLLSGGEKALSAIALIFAIFKTKPSPFCVLDEIDAALDESNIDRFSRMLSDFSKTSQFIVITHNKKTISRASCMYGITMERSGISKIVSVKLHENSAAPAEGAAKNESLPSQTA